MLYPMKDRS